MSRSFWGLSASGILLQRESDGKICLFHRSGTMNSGTWGINGGKVDKGKTTKSSAIDEVKEEAGSMPKGRFTGRTYIYRTQLSEDDYIDGDDPESPDENRYAEKGEEFTYTTFHYIVTDDEWEPDLNWEHDDWAWYDPENIPTNTLTLKDENGKTIKPVDLMLKKIIQRKSNKNQVKETFANFFKK